MHLKSVKQLNMHLKLKNSKTSTTNCEIIGNIFLQIEEVISIFHEKFNSFYCTYFIF
jgi:hypothetical protein